MSSLRYDRSERLRPMGRLRQHVDDEPEALRRHKPGRIIAAIPRRARSHSCRL